MKLGEILKELGKLKTELMDAREIIVRYDDQSQSYEDWLIEHGVYDEDVIVVNIWIPST
jgi:hypothetical protein